MHGKLAALADDVEQRSRHLALAADGPDEAVAVQLDAAVRNAAARGATAAAAELAELAIVLTRGDAIARRSTAAHFHHLAGDFAGASELYAQVAEGLPPGAERADALYLRALNGLEDLPGRIRLCEQALSDADHDDVRCAQIHGFQAISRWVHGDISAALAEARVGLERAERAEDPQTIAVAIGRLGYLEACALEVTPGLFERGMEIEAALPEPLFFLESPSFFHAVALCVMGELDRSREMLERDVGVRDPQRRRARAAVDAPAARHPRVVGRPAVPVAEARGGRTGDRPADRRAAVPGDARMGGRVRRSGRGPARRGAGVSPARTRGR